MSQKKRVVLSIVALSTVAILIIVGIPIFAQWLLQRSRHQTYLAISKIALPCDQHTSQVIEPWSKSGYSVSCRSHGVIDGPWQAWEAGRIAISGNYTGGKQHGRWLIYSNDGKRVHRTITYENGTEVTNVVH